MDELPRKSAPMRRLQTLAFWFVLLLGPCAHAQFHQEWYYNPAVPDRSLAWWFDVTTGGHVAFIYPGGLPDGTYYFTRYPGPNDFYTIHDYVTISGGVPQTHVSGVLSWRFAPYGTTVFDVYVQSSNPAWQAQYGNRKIGQITYSAGAVAGLPPPPLGFGVLKDLGLVKRFTMPGGNGIINPWPFIGQDTDAITPSDGSTGGDNNPKCGMARYSANTMQAALSVSDRPLVYEPAFGPGLGFTIGPTCGLACAPSSSR